MILYELILFVLTFFVALRKPHHFRRFFASPPNAQGKEVIWIHAVSVGEAKSAQTLFAHLRASYPNTFFLITTATATGLSEARRSLPTADAFALLPLDYRLLVNRWVKNLRPKLFLLIESDFWPNLLSAIKKHGGKTAVVSGRLSLRSAKRFANFCPFSKKFFNRLDLVCVQNEEHRARFLPFVDPSRIQIGGNLKLDHRKSVVDRDFWHSTLGASGPAITLSCTHAPEEEKLLERLPLEKVFLFLAPRHPERFNEVAKILESKKIPFFRWSEPEKRRGGERVLLVDAMGQLPICYALSRLAIVAGSFRPDIGGHNILEPCLYDLPVFFGPHVFSQEELVRFVLEAKAGLQVSYESLQGAVEQFFNTPSEEKAMRGAALALQERCRGASTTTAGILQRFLEKV